MRKKRGGLKGHKGKTLEMVDNPTHMVMHKASTCAHCDRSLIDASPEGYERRRVFDIPPIISKSPKNDVGHRIPRRYDYDKMYMVTLNTESLYLHIRVVFLNLMNPLGNELFQRSFQDLLPIFRYPYYVKLMMICSMGAPAVSPHSDLTTTPYPKKCAFFHPLADARGPQRQP